MKPFVMPSAVVCGNGLSVHLFLVDATECGMSNDDLFVRRQCWLQYFFGTRTTAVKPTLLTVSASLVRLVVIGRGETSAMSTFMPMADDDPQQAQGAVGQPVALTYVQPQDVDLQGPLFLGAELGQRELEELPDGTLHRVPFCRVLRRVCVKV
ncbi:hypothetical protein MOQ_002804 [Trypanosoma cruzi marinkellei]|uniref:Uncharacterized protein n=1 Tax=Trypanosoma cruzi marinkellei TaxID=85056 RepID=K2NED5_TRYCR|nr:hypothetical protein MOQ_002804 [Trypanosoma cruzi marinkellei]